MSRGNFHYTKARAPCVGYLDGHTRRTVYTPIHAPTTEFGVGPASLPCSVVNSEAEAWTTTGDIFVIRDLQNNFLSKRASSFSIPVIRDQVQQRDLNYFFIFLVNRDWGDTFFARCDECDNYNIFFGKQLYFQCEM